MKLKFTRKTWYFLLLASAAASMLNGFAVLSGTSFSLIEQIAFAAAGIAALFLAAEKGSAPNSSFISTPLLFPAKNLCQISFSGWF